MPNTAITNRQLLQIIMVAVAVWGTTLALGAFLYGRDPESGNITFSISPIRGLIVFGCVASFLGFWAIMLATRRGRSVSHGDHEIDDDHPSSKQKETDPLASEAAIVFKSPASASEPKREKRPMSDVEFRGWLVFVVVATTILYFELVATISGIVRHQPAFLSISRFCFVLYVLYSLWLGNAFARWLIVGCCFFAGLYTVLFERAENKVFAISIAVVYVAIGIVLTTSKGFGAFLERQREAS